MYAVVSLASTSFFFSRILPRLTPTCKSLIHETRNLTSSRRNVGSLSASDWGRGRSKSKRVCLHPLVKLTSFASRSFDPAQPNEDFVFRQLLEYKSYTYTYLLADAATHEAILIDPVFETAERDMKIIFELGLTLIYTVNTHIHADHITGSGEIKKYLQTCKSVISEVSKARADVKLKEGDLIKFGKFNIEARSTPGHTDGCMTFVWHEKGMVFTGDALLIRGCGRTDFQQGDSATLYGSVHTKILSLPQHFKVFPAHDYTGQTMSTIGEELRFNPRLSRPKNEFLEVMSKMHLPYPKQMGK
ncbi:unnamed protein product [Candidula unifasciata]|uniref:Persulfide dioxygenase ETHE1, mitochondrial n=1 Tax=Candidula unifasciata TaxID=100452 RepID=A0A8S3YPW6_9EUPU|nr:unnamed protein product [Candidula unifasciata]